MGASGSDQVARYVSRGRDVLVDTNGPPRLDTVFECLTACSNQEDANASALLVVPTAGDVRALEDIAEARPEPSGDLIFLGRRDDARKEVGSLARTGSVVTTPARLIDHIRRRNVDLSGVSVCLISPPAGDVSKFEADLHFIYAKFDQPPSTVLFQVDEDETGALAAELLRRPAAVKVTASSDLREPQKESQPMSTDTLPFDEDSTGRQLREIVRRIHEDEDPEEMNRYRRFIRKNVSVFHRGYFMAYLFKQGVLGETDSGTRKSVFVSAGRNRRVHARDLVTLFTSAEGVERDDIGQIKVLDNYSFVEVEASKAQAAIDALDGTDFRGRKLTVNFARKK